MCHTCPTRPTLQGLGTVHLVYWISNTLSVVPRCASMYLNVLLCTSMYFNVPQCTSMYLFFVPRCMLDIKQLDHLFVVPQYMYIGVPQCASMYLNVPQCTWTYLDVPDIKRLNRLYFVPRCEAFAQIANCSTLIAMSSTLATVMELYIRGARQEI